MHRKDAKCAKRDTIKCDCTTEDAENAERNKIENDCMV